MEELVAFIFSWHFIAQLVIAMVLSFILSKTFQWEIKQNKKKYSLLSVGILITISPFYFYIYHFWGRSISENTNTWGSFGSYIGGVLSFISIMILAFAQYKQMQDRKKDTFEKTFNLIVEQHNKLLDKSHNSFINLFNKIKPDAKENKLHLIMDSNSTEKVKEVLNLFNDDKTYAINTYLRTLYRSLKYLDENEESFEKNDFYSGLLRSLVPENVLLIIALNVMRTDHPRFENFHNYLIKYNFLEHINLSVFSKHYADILSTIPNIIENNKNTISKAKHDIVKNENDIKKYQDKIIKYQKAGIQPTDEELKKYRCVDENTLYCNNQFDKNCIEFYAFNKMKLEETSENINKNKEKLRKSKRIIKEVTPLINQDFSKYSIVIPILELASGIEVKDSKKYLPPFGDNPLCIELYEKYIEPNKQKTHESASIPQTK